jgi:hypothetical protein
MVGLAVFAVIGAVVTWFAVNLLWALAIKLQRRRAAARYGIPRRLRP